MTKLTTPPDLLPVLFGAVRSRLLAAMFQDPTVPRYLRDLARAAQTSAGTAARELSPLVVAGLLSREPIGRQVFYRVRPEAPFFRELGGIFQQSTDWIQPLRAALQPVSSQLSAVCIYGSAARGASNPLSDLDLLVIGQTTYAEMYALLAPVEKVIGREINPVLLSLPDYQRRFEEGHSFILTVIRGPKVWLIGDEHVLG